MESAGSKPDTDDQFTEGPPLKSDIKRYSLYAVSLLVIIFVAITVVKVQPKTSMTGQFYDTVSLDADSPGLNVTHNISSDSISVKWQVLANTSLQNLTVRTDFLGNESVFKDTYNATLLYSNLSSNATYNFTISACYSNNSSLQCNNATFEFSTPGQVPIELVSVNSSFANNSLFIDWQLNKAADSTLTILNKSYNFSNNSRFNFSTAMRDNASSYDFLIRSCDKLLCVNYNNTLTYQAINITSFNLTVNTTKAQLDFSVNKPVNCEILVADDIESFEQDTQFEHTITGLNSSQDYNLTINLSDGVKTMSFYEQFITGNKTDMNETTENETVSNETQEEENNSVESLKIVSRSLVVNNNSATISWESNKKAYAEIQVGKHEKNYKKSRLFEWSDKLDYNTTYDYRIKIFNDDEKDKYQSEFTTEAEPVSKDKDASSEPKVSTTKTKLPSRAEKTEQETESSVRTMSAKEPKQESPKKVENKSNEITTNAISDEGHEVNLQEQNLHDSENETKKKSKDTNNHVVFWFITILCTPIAIYSAVKTTQMVTVKIKESQESVPNQLKEIQNLIKQKKFRKTYEKFRHLQQTLPNHSGAEIEKYNEKIKKYERELYAYYLVKLLRTRMKALKVAENQAEKLQEIRKILSELSGIIKTINPNDNRLTKTTFKKYEKLLNHL